MGLQPSGDCLQGLIHRCRRPGLQQQLLGNLSDEECMLHEFEAGISLKLFYRVVSQLGRPGEQAVILILIEERKPGWFAHLTAATRSSRPADPA